MIQRIQTVYLLLGAAMLAVFAALGGIWAPGLDRVAMWLPAVTYALAVLAALVALGSVFLYKDRKRQRAVIGYALWLALLTLVPLLVGLFASTPQPDLGASGAVEPLGLYGRYLVALAPLVAFVLLRMARRGVDRDISTIRSMDRIR